MAAKISIQDITDAGFRAAQFGTPDGEGAQSWDGAGGYLDRVIARAEQWSRGRFGGRYDAVDVDTPAGEYLRAAELCWASAQLWKRRAAFIDANAVSSLEALAYRDREQFLDAAERAMACAEEQMALAIDPDQPAGSALGFAVAVTGPWKPRGLACG
ncbi:hypothetical protein [Stenotrophomonas sp. MMGLT7]|uniref:hypothetical protein n=1 Tax=Stenotrophomonas sp. MMGLT7 TaxID=2901227 RepID=UPI001E2B61C9|nr:hypothetical protein [Stenotrophomonas sp. MMGLT7]MCD7096940.1 hypothetical protein [Stenotrophomonas sp. MMGLT7]